VASARTAVAGVIGSPVRHSLSPALHNAAYRAAGLDWVYAAFEVAPGGAADALVGVRALGLRGLSVTMPHKADVAAAVDVLEPAAAELAAVNCVTNVGGRLEGSNTDGDGFVDSLRLDEGVDVAGRRCVVLGAGGAARAVVRALADAGAAAVVVVSRRPDPVVVAAELAGAVGAAGTLADVAGADLVVNATPVGMGPAPDPAALPCDPALLGPGQVVVDLIYQPLETALVAAARERGATAVGGLGMLVHQAAHQFRRWTGLEPPLAAMRAAALDELAARTGPPPA
jgi:shikimate dehydrogenase